MSAYFEKIASTPLSRKLAHFLVPHFGNNHHPYLIRHEALYIFILIILMVQFFSFSGISSANVLGYGTDINRAAVINLTNQERTSRGLNALKENSQLNSAAEQKASHMFTHDYWAHFAPDGTSPWYFFNQAGYKYSYAGENLARDFSTSAGVIAGWMASQGHKDNLLNPNFVDIGIGVMNGTLDGKQTTLVVQHLATPIGGSSSNSKPTSGSIVGKSNSSTPVTVEDKFNVSTKSKGQDNEKQATIAANIDQIQERIASANTPFSFNLGSFWQGLGLGQKTTVALLSLLFCVFLFDSVIIFRKGVMRHNSHSLLHAIVLAILIVAVIRSATGGVL